MAQTRRSRRPLPALLVVTLSLTLVSCASDSTGPVASTSAPPPSAPPPAPTIAHQSTAPAVDELTDRSPQVCPRRLPRQDDPGHGFGPEEYAETAPLLATPERAWVCRYGAVDAGPHADGQGRTLGWQRRGRARPVTPDRMPALAAQLARLVPPATPQPERVCTADLGERWALVYAIGTDLTGVVADDFSCGDIRLTDDPFTTPPGEATQPGTVAGVLEAPGFVGLLRSTWTDARE